MTDQGVNGLKVAILVTDGFEQVELTEPREALDKAGAETRIVSPKDAGVRGWNFSDWGRTLPVDLKLDQARPDDFDALLLPGGVMNPDKLRLEPKAVAFVRAFSTPENRSQRSATARGPSSRPGRPAAER